MERIKRGKTERGKDRKGSERRERNRKTERERKVKRCEGNEGEEMKKKGREMARKEDSIE